MQAKEQANKHASNGAREHKCKQANKRARKQTEIQANRCRGASQITLPHVHKNKKQIIAEATLKFIWKPHKHDIIWGLIKMCLREYTESCHI